MIRKATVFDIPRINELGNILNSNWSKVNNLNEMLNDSVTKVIVYEQNDNIVGFISATAFYDTCDILSIVVDPNFRNKKIASNLIAYLISDLGENLKLITLEVASKNIPAINLYEKFGFEIINVRKNYYKDDDAYLMARKSEEQPYWKLLS